MEGDLSLVRFTTLNFFAVLMNSRPFNPISTLLIKIVSSLISCEPEPDKKNKQRLNWIYNNTHERIREPLSIIELAVFKNIDRGLNRELEVGDKAYTLAEIYKYLDEVILELTQMVISIAKKYSVDIPMSLMGVGMASSNRQEINI